MTTSRIPTDDIMAAATNEQRTEQDISEVKDTAGRGASSLDTESSAPAIPSLVYKPDESEKDESEKRSVVAHVREVPSYTSSVSTLEGRGSIDEKGINWGAEAARLLERQAIPHGDFMIRSGTARGLVECVSSLSVRSDNGGHGGISRWPEEPKPRRVRALRMTRESNQ